MLRNIDNTYISYSCDADVVHVYMALNCNQNKTHQWNRKINLIRLTCLSVINLQFYGFKALSAYKLASYKLYND